MRNGVMRAMLIAISVVILSGSILMIYMMFSLDKRDIVEVHIGESGSEAVEFSSINIKPGDSDECVMAVSSDLSGNCNLTLDFEETKEGNLKHCLNVSVEVDGDVIYEGTLEELLKKDTKLTRQCEVKKRDSLGIKVKYNMPIEVGNEAKTTTADFLLRITLSNE